MKRTVFVLALLVSMASFAQHRGGPKHGHEELEKMTPEQVATLKSKKMALALDLSENQQQKIEALILDEVKFHQQKREERKAMKEKGEKPSSKERFDFENAQLDRKLAVQEKMKNILNDEQFEKWQKFNHHRHRKGKRKMHNEKEGRRR